MANRVLAPIQQILTSAGALASGYQLFVYQSGTTTKQAIYPTATDADGATNALTNPIVLNSRGEASTNGTTPTSVYVPDATTSVKLVLALGSDSDPPSSPVRTEDALKLASASAATTTNSGIVELATNAETVTGTDTTRVTTPANITAKMAAPGAIGGTTPSTIAGTTITGTTITASTGFVTQGGLALAQAATVKSSADQTSVSTTLADATSLSLAVVSGNYYLFEFFLRWETTVNTSALRVGLTTPTFGTRDFHATVIGHDGAGVGFPGFGGGGFGASGGSVDLTAGGSINTAYSAVVSGTIKPTANGTIQLQFARNAGTGTITLHEGSCGRLTLL